LSSVLARLDWRPPRSPVITVAGTNGKGSVVAYCDAILRASGLRVGTFSSPHLIDYRERIRIDSRWASEAELIAAFERIERARGNVPLTFFEYNTLAALLLFRDHELDAWVLEVGLGGRLDAVNIVDTDVAVLVNIGFDHQQYLGDTLQSIGREKAGIFRAGKPAVLGSADLPSSVYEVAHTLGARLKRPGRDFRYVATMRGWSYAGPRWSFDNLPRPALAGEVQIGNAATAIAALEELELTPALTQSAVTRGLTALELPGRYQKLAGSPSWVLDVAHNPQAARVLAENLAADPCRGKTWAVCGILLDKDAPAIVREVATKIDGWWLAGIDGERGCSARALRARIAGVLPLETPVEERASIVEACQAASAQCDAADRIVVFGSFHSVGPALQWLGYNSQPIHGP
jgi:dihydrofolate synthase / folylpolyglutamate synthase